MNCTTNWPPLFRDTGAGALALLIGAAVALSLVLS